AWRDCLEGAGNISLAPEPRLWRSRASAVVFGVLTDKGIGKRGLFGLGRRTRVLRLVEGMSSYYGEAWPTYGVELDSFEGPSEEGRRSDTSGWSQWSIGGRRQRAEANTEWFEMASNASGEGSESSWWKGDCWSWDSWDGSSSGSRENWAYVTRREPGGHWDHSDPWHQWHSGGREHAHGQGEVRRSAQDQGHDAEPLEHSGGSDGGDLPKGDLPSGKVTSVQERADKAEEKKLSGKVSNSYPPVFRARQGENYRDWKRSVKFWLHGEGQQLPTSLVGPRVMVQLRDRAAQLVKHLEPEDVGQKEGLQRIFETLEKSPFIKQSEKHRVDWHRKRLLTLSRVAGESLESYITRAGLYRAQLEGLDAALSMGERFFVGHLLDHARLTRRDKAMIKTHAGDEDEVLITGAMMELSSELEGEQGYPIGQAETQLSGAQGEEHLVQRGVLGLRFNRRDKAALVAELNEVDTETNVSLEGIPEDPAGDESCDEGDPQVPSDVLHAEHEALALQFRAKQKMAVKAALAASPNPVLVTAHKLESDHETEWGLLESLCKDSLAADSSARAVYMVQRAVCGNDLGATTPKHETPVVPFEAWWNMKELSRKVILDLGCMRNVVGVQWANDVVSEWQQQQRWFRVLEEDEVFRFGDGNTLRSKYRLQLQATFGGKMVLLAFSVVPGPCPPLLSKQSHTQLGVQLDTEHHTMSSRKLHVKNYGLSETRAGHYTVSIDEFHLIEEAGEAETEFLMEHHQEVGMAGHRTRQCPNLSDPESLVEVDSQTGDSFQEVEHLQRQEEPRQAARKEPPTSMEVDKQPKGRGRGPAARAAAIRGESSTRLSPMIPEQMEKNTTTRRSGKINRGLPPSEDEGPGQRLVETDAIQGLTMQELQMVYKHREKEEEEKAKKKMATAALTGWESRYPSLSNVWSDDLACNILKCFQSRMRTYLWKKVVWQLRVKEAIRVESKGGIDLGAFRSNEAEAEIFGLHREEEWHRLQPQRGMMQKLKKGMGEVCAQQALVTTLAGARPYYVVMEIFAGCARLTARGSVREGWRAMEPIDIIYGYDLKNPVTQKQILDRIGDLKPDLVTLSPRCGPWSQMQRINPNVDKVMEDRQQDIPLWRFCRKVWDEQDKNGRLVLTENPYQSAALTMDFMMERANLHRAKIPQRAFGLKDAVSGKPHQKYTALDVNDAGMREALMEGATCRHTPEEHQPIEGNVFYNGRWQRRSALAAKWPEELCDHILRAAESAWEKCDQHAPKKLTEGREAGAAHYILPVEPTPTPEGELRRQLEKTDWRGGQYDYVYFDGVARQGPYKMRQALAHLHVVLGHPSMERLVRMLMISGCSNQVVEIAKGLRCQICQAVRPPGAEPKVAATRPTRFGERVLSDSFFVWDVKGERFNVTHMIDGLTEYHMGLVSKQVGADVTTELLQNRWCAVLGPPEVLQTDGGKEYADVVQRVSRLLDFRHEVVPPGAKWRQGQVERHGAIIKLMMMRVISTQQAAGLEEIKLVAASCFNAKNRLCNRAGLSPLQAVTGKNATVPVSVMEQLCSGQVRFAMNEELELRDALRRAERIRAAAIDSYNWIDSNQVIREGLNRRSRPPKLEGIFEGTTVYVHEPPPNRRGQHRRLQDHSSWDGPGLVVCVERQQNVPNRVWVRIRGKVRSYPLEKLRLATPDEMLGSQFIVQILEEMQDEIKKGNLRLEEDRNQPVRALPAVSNTPANMEEVDNEMLDDTQVQERMRRVRRMEIMNDVPDSIRQGALSSSSQSSRVLVRKLDASERRDLLMEDDAEMSEEPVAPAEEVEPSRLRFPEKKALFEKGRREGGLPSTLTEARVRSGMGLASRQVKNIRKLINKQRRAPMTPQARQQRSEEQSVGSLVMLAEVLEPTPHEVLWQESCKELEEQEAFWNSPLVKKKDLQKINTKIEDKVYEHRSDLARGKIVTGKARLEYQWSQLNEEWKKAYEQPLVKAVKIYFDHDALAGVPKDKVINPKRILSTRFVLTNKGGPELQDAILKARLILGGHMDPDMGKYATLAPTAALLAHNLINWIAVQKRWVVNYEDVSSAFLQGKPLPKEREVYIRLPKGYPECVWKFILEQLGADYREDLMQLTKGGFGLPESPRLWYLCYRDTLKECDMKEMDILPGVFAAYHPDGELRALACIHVDDTRFCGDETSQEIWDKIHQKLKFGELRRATQGWTKFCGRWERQNPETLEFEYAMEEYAKDIQKVKLPTGNAKTASTAISPEEKLQMSSILGQLNWMARQGRYDLSYGVSHVQQLAAREGRIALEWLNKVVYRAKQPAIQVVKRLKDWRNYIIVSASDAAYGAQPGGYSQGGLVICIADKGILDGEANLAVVEAASMKIQRVVSMASAREHYLVIDSKTGFDVLNNETQTSDRKIQIDLAVLKQALMEEDINAFVRWVPGHHLIADAMTKWYSNNELERALAEGVWSLKDTSEAQDLRKEAAKKRQIYRKAARMDQRGDV
ncbi:unnamed protein product, partial [Cladocopium goreaui]